MPTVPMLTVQRRYQSRHPSMRTRPSYSVPAAAPSGAGKTTVTFPRSSGPSVSCAGDAVALGSPDTATAIVRWAVEQFVMTKVSVALLHSAMWLVQLPSDWGIQHGGGMRHAAFGI